MKRLSLTLMFLFLSACGATQSPGHAAIATAHPLATAAGEEVLAAGGNAFDAAIAVTATLAVVEPYSSGIGGGGFWLLHRASDGREVMIDGREKAPLAADRDMYLDKDGNVVPGLSVDGPLAAGIPGVPAAMVHLAKHYGRLPLSESLAPAIRAAREGFKVTPHYRLMAQFRRPVLLRSDEAAAQFLQDGEVPELGHVIKQAHLAATLEAIAAEGDEGFYHGPIAEELVRAVKAAGGNWSLDDLRQYQVVERRPLVGVYHGMRIVTVPPPSSGGVALITMLNILGAYDLKSMDTVSRTHLVVEAMRRAYRDRAEYLGDSDFVSVPVHELISPEHARTIAADIERKRATPSAFLKPAVPSGSGKHTTHFSIIDRDGNRVSATLSVNYPFGSAFVAGSTGVLLNDEMDDFSAKPGTPNVYGLVGAHANAIEPGKRPLSSMSPTFVESKQGVAILGTPGGSRIITMVLLGILDIADGHLQPLHWVALPRYHHQYLPDVIQYEEGSFSEAEVKALEEMGYNLQAVSPYGNMQAVWWNRHNNTLDAASDPRVEGKAVVIP